MKPRILIVEDDEAIDRVLVLGEIDRLEAFGAARLDVREAEHGAHGDRGARSADVHAARMHALGMAARDGPRG